MKRILLLVLTIFNYLLSNCAFAAVPIPGWYGTLFGGYANVLKNIDLLRDSYRYDNIRYEPGFDAGGTFGFKSNPMRYEGEFKYIRARPTKFAINNYIPTGISGFSTAYLGFANIYYDFPTIIEPLEPYLGFGIGYGYIFTKVLHDGIIFNTEHRFQDSVFAYQPIVGVTYNFSEFYALNVDYRYVGTSHMDNYGKRYQANLFNVGLVFRLDGKIYK